MSYKRNIIKEVFGLKDGEILSWTERGFISPDIKSYQGTGNPNEYSKKNLIEIGIMKEVRDNGVSVRKSSQIKDMIMRIFTKAEEDYPELIYNPLMESPKGRVVDIAIHKLQYLFFLDAESMEPLYGFYLDVDREEITDVSNEDLKKYKSYIYLGLKKIRDDIDRKL